MSNSGHNDDDLSIDSDEELELNIVDDDDIDSIDYENPKVEIIGSKEPKSKDSSIEKTNFKIPFDKNDQFKINNPISNKDNLLLENDKNIQGYNSMTKNKYSGMLDRLSKNNIKFDDKVKEFRFNINYERRYFLKFAGMEKAVEKSKIKEFLKEEEKNDNYNTCKSCMECGISFFLPSFQLLR